MPITYCPPKGQRWGHGVMRLSPLELYERSERFLSEQAIVVDLPEPVLTIRWNPTESNPFSHAVDAFPPNAGRADEDREGNNFFGSAWRRITRSLSPASLRPAVDWLETIDSQLNNRGELIPSIVLYRFVWFQWRDSPSKGNADVPLPHSSLNIFYSRPRHVSTMFQFETVRHYYEVKQHLRDLGLVTLSDKHVRPKWAISETAIDGI